tara:strand:- start:114 stop:548 length:435 start_codon:yes stop_codon:yes gene_type:complete
MKKKISIILFFVFFLFEVNANNNFFDEAKKKYDEENLKDSKFLFQKNIVFNPKHAKSYLYLAKIYNSEENKKEEIKNLKTVLLLEPENEEAIYLLIEIELEKSNFSEVKDLMKKFEIVCLNLCKKIENIEERLQDFDLKNSSKE